jgi:hypothetical protein
MALGATGASMSGWLKTLAAETADDPKRQRSCILLWMSGGPTQTDTFDMKPGHTNAGEFKEIDTAVSGIRISEHLPKLAQQMQHVAPIRSMTSKEGDHSRASFLLRTGYLPQGPVQYPTLGSLYSKELGSAEAELPSFVSATPYRFLSPAAYGPVFLGPKFSPLVVSGNGLVAAQPGSDAYKQALKVENLSRPKDVALTQADARLKLLDDLERDFLSDHPDVTARSHRATYKQAVRMMRSEAKAAFQLDSEPDKLRDSYGRNTFGQGCLLARRLVERGVPFVEVSLNGVGTNQGFGWDTHANNFDSVRQLCGVLDPAWATLISDLKSRGLLDSTLIVWMGEFGRTPKINRSSGRDHFAAAWTTVLSGGGIRGGQVIGNTSGSGTRVTDRPVTVPDFLATVCGALGIDSMKQNMSNVGRPIRIVDPESEAIKELLL